MIPKTVLILSILTFAFCNKAHLESEDLAPKVASEDRDNTFWGSRCSLGKMSKYKIERYVFFFFFSDLQCLSVDIGDTRAQVSVCQSKAGGGECEPSAVIWVGLAFIILTLSLAARIIVLRCCHNQQRKVNEAC